MFSLGTIDGMNAAEIRKRAERAKAKVDTPDVTKLLEFVHERIAAAADEGKFSVSDPWSGYRMAVTLEQVVTLATRLLAEGYAIHRRGKGIKISWQHAGKA